MTRSDRLQAPVDALMATSKVVAAVVSRSLAVARSSVTTPQLRVLVMLSARGNLNLTEVARGLGVNASSASRTCDRLVTARLLVRREDPRDRRNVVLGLSRSGSRLVDRLMAERRDVFAQLADRMSPADLKLLRRGLDAFLQAADALAAEQDPPDDSGHLLSWLT